MLTARPNLNGNLDRFKSTAPTKNNKIIHFIPSKRPCNDEGRKHAAQIYTLAAHHRIGCCRTVWYSSTVKHHIIPL